MMKNNIRRFKAVTPVIAAGVFVDPTALIIGDVHVAAQASIWPFVVIRGDVNKIRIGKGSNVQDLSMLHVSHKTLEKPQGSALVIGENVTIGHRVTLHGCTVGNCVLVGMGSCVLDDAVIEDYVMIGAGSLVPPRKVLEAGFLYVGSPVKQVRRLQEDEKVFLKYSAEHYQRLAQEYLHSLAAKGELPGFKNEDGTI